MSWTDLLTPESSRGPWEAAVEATSAERWPLPWQILRTLHDPWLIPEDKLPILAWALSVDIWDPAWDIAKKRAVVADSLRMHALKGTLDGYKAYLALVDAELLQVVAPPQGMFLAGEPDPAAVAAYIARLPEIRVFLESRTGTADAGLYLDSDYLDDAGLVEDRGPALYGRRAVLHRGDVETELVTYTVQEVTLQREVIDHEEVSIPGDAGWALVLDADFLDDRYFDGEAAPAQMLRYDLHRTEDYTESRFPVSVLQPGFAPISPRYVRDSLVGDAGASLMLDADFLDDGFLVEDHALSLIYDRLRLYDPALIAPQVLDGDFLDDARLGMDPWNAEMLIKSERISGMDEMFLDASFLDADHLVLDDLERINNAMDAVVAAKGFRDRILLAFDTMRPRTLGDGIRMDGSFKIGGMVRRYL